MLVDTHAVYKDLVKAGFEDRKANAIVKSISANEKTVATKHDIENLRLEFDKMGTEFDKLRAEFDKLRSDIGAKLNRNMIVTILCVPGILVALNLIGIFK